MKRKLIQFANRIIGPALVWVTWILQPLWLRKTEGQESVLLCKMVGLGDTVYILPIVAELRKRFPNLRISILSTPITSKLFDLHPDVDEVIVVDALGKDLSPRALLRLIKKLRHTSFSSFLDFEQHYYLAPVLASWIGIKERIGLMHPMRRLRGRLLSHPVDFNANVHMGAAYGAILAEYCRLRSGPGFDPAAMPIAPYRLSLPDDARARMERGLREAGIRPTTTLIGLHPGSGGSGQYRRWPLQNFVTLGRQLLKHRSVKLVVDGGPGETDLVRELCAQLPASRVLPAADLAFLDFLVLLEQLDCYVSNDTGPMHIAPTLGTPVVGLFGPVTPQQYAPARGIALYHRMHCSPCIQIHAGHVPADCTHRFYRACMRGIDPSVVEEAVLSVLKRK